MLSIKIKEQIIRLECKFPKKNSVFSYSPVTGKSFEKSQKIKIAVIRILKKKKKKITKYSMKKQENCKRSIKME